MKFKITRYPNSYHKTWTVEAENKEKAIELAKSQDVDWNRNTPTLSHIPKITFRDFLWFSAEEMSSSHQ